MTDIPPDRDTLPDEIVPDYSRLGFRELRAKCKGREIPADGTHADLIRKLRAWDAEHGADVDLTVPDEFDLLDDEDGEDDRPQDTPRQNTQASAGGGGDASLTPPPADLPPDRGPEMPAVTVVAEEGSHKLPVAMLRPNVVNLAARSGVVKVGEGHGAAEVRAFRHEVVVGERDITDVDHFRWIAEAHAAAQAAGHVTKGGVTIGERVGYGADADGRRTAIYQVPLKRNR